MTMTATPFRLDGATGLIPVLGSPVAQVRSPPALTRRLQEEGVNAINVPLHVAPGHLSSVVEALKNTANIMGFVFTVPHKIAALRLADRVTSGGSAAGSINVLRREPDGSWLGDILDGQGFVVGLRHDGHDPARHDVLIIGAGGVGGAIAAALAEAGVRALALYDIDRAKCEALARRLSSLYPSLPIKVLETPAHPAATMAVNATSLGLNPDDPLPLDLATLAPETVVAEVVMNPPVTALLEAAGARGHPVVLGENIFVHQLDKMAAFFLDPAAP